ncbi:MAG: hypothetical protein A2Z34_08725 [Planctomycetes bacterium RBG_16_59_8]|nr:MAG: hypothetical protein A2Z34_08725 [Planctomycetes bacterium RBG_16_59_8]
MKIKLDENVDHRLIDFFAAARHDVETVEQEKMSGADDIDLYRRCVEEKRTLVTFDKDFSNPLRYSPSDTRGIIVMRGHNNRFATMRLLVETLIVALENEDPCGRLWIIDPGRLRVHEE